MQRAILSGAALIAVAAARVAHADQDGKPWDGTTIGYQIGTGVGGGVIGVGLGGGFALAAVHNDPSWDAIGYIAVGAAAGGLVGSIAGVQLEGDHQHGTGSLWATSLGGGVGFASFCVATWKVPDSVSNYEPWWALLPTLTLAGEIIGYHASAHDPGPTPIMLSLAHGEF